MARNSLSRIQEKLNPDLVELAKSYDLKLKTTPKWLNITKLKPAINSLYWFEPKDWLTLRGIDYLKRGSEASPLILGKGDLTMPLWIRRNQAKRPKEHWALWRGDIPHAANGKHRSEFFPSDEHGNLVSPQKGVLLMSYLPPGPYPPFKDYRDKALWYIAHMKAEIKKFKEGINANVGDDARSATKAPE